MFNLRAFDRINKTPALEALEKEAGVDYHDIQRGIAESIMSESVHPSIGKEGDKHEKSYDTGDEEKEQEIDRLRRFQEKQKNARADQFKSKDTVAHVTMLNGGKMSDEVWEGDPENEKSNFVQEELYIHGKVLVADDRVTICGSANINDRVSPSSAAVAIRANGVSPNSDSMIVSLPLSWKIRTSSTARWTANRTGQAGMPLLCAGNCGGSISACCPRRITTLRNTPTRNPQTCA